MDTNLKKKASDLLQMAIDAGANQADVILSKGSQFSLSAQNNDIDKYKVSGSQVIGLRVIKDQKIGLSYTESLAEDAMQIAVNSALDNAQNSEANEFESIESKEEEFIFEAEGKTDNSSTSEKIEFVLGLEEKVKQADKRVTAVPYNGLSVSDSESYYLNSNNVFGFQAFKYLSCHTSALINENGNSSMHYHGEVGHSLKELNYKKCISESVFHASEWLKAKSLKTNNYDIIFTLDAFEQVFMCFSNIFSGKGAMDQVNPFREKIGKKILGGNLSLRDIPQYKDTFIKSYFDSEGFASTDLTLIEDGVLKSFYHNSVTAKFFKIPNTGHAARGAKSALGVSGNTKVISGGSLTDENLKQGSYFEIHSLQGLHSGANKISGEFSFAASGYFCENGKVLYPVKGVTVSGNFHKMLASIEQAGSAIHATGDKGFFAPLIKFEKVSVAGE